VLPEGNHSVVLSVIEGKLVVDFFSESAAQVGPADPQVCPIENVLTWD